MLSTVPILLAYKFTLKEKYFDHFKWIHDNYPQFYDIIKIIPCGLFIVEKGDKLEVFLTVVLITILAHCLFALWFSIRGLINFFIMLRRTSNELQKQYVWALSMQCILPGLCLVIPYTLLVIGNLIKNDTLAEIANCSIALGSFHSFFNAISLIFIIDSYRQTIKRLIWCQKEELETFPSPRSNEEPNILELHKIESRTQEI
uniref:Uncharacterized protein n=1 Tax=Panagrolaimus sp. JU765 TaxID=591449 RepID=A0AC34Q9P2_9BILA